MSLDYGELHKTARGRVHLVLDDLKWHTNGELSKKSVGGIRYSARILELKRLGYQIEDQHLDADKKTGKRYRLLSREPGKPKPKKVKVYLEERDVQAILGGSHVPPRALTALKDALGSFQTNKGKL